MNPIRSTVLSIVSAAVLVWALAGPAAGQNILASVPIPTASAGQVAVNPALNMIYSGGGPNAGGTSLTVIDGSTFSVVTTISPSAGVSADMKNDNFWGGDLTAGDVIVYASNNTQISSTKVNSCPAAVSFDCHGRRMWVASQCGTGNDPVWVFNADTLALINGPITPSGTITQPPVVNPIGGKFYVTSGGVSREIDPKTFAVSTTTFGTVLAIDSNSNKLFATSGNNLQIITGRKRYHQQNSHFDLHSRRYRSEQRYVACVPCESCRELDRRVRRGRKENHDLQPGSRQSAQRPRGGFRARPVVCGCAEYGNEFMVAGRDRRSVFPAEVRISRRLRLLRREQRGATR